MADRIGVQIAAEDQKLDEGMRRAGRTVADATTRMQQAFDTAGRRMSAAMDGARASLNASLGAIGTNLATVGNEAQTTGNKVAAATSRMTGSQSAISSLAGHVRGLVLAYVGLQSVSGLVRVADEVTLLDSRLRILIGNEKEAAQVKAELYDRATRLQAGVQTMAGSFVRLYPAIKQMNGGIRETIQLAELQAMTARLSGASTAEAAGSAIQFAQAMASGVLRGDEFRSVNEGNNLMIRLLAKGIGVTTGELKKMADQGKLTADVVANALLKQYDAVAKQSGQITATISGSWRRVANSFARLVSTANTAGGPFATMSRILEGLSKALDAVALRIERFTRAGADLASKNNYKEFLDTTTLVFAKFADIAHIAYNNIMVMVTGVSMLGQALGRLKDFDFKGVGAAIADGYKEVFRLVKESAQLATGKIGVFHDVSESQRTVSGQIGGLPATPTKPLKGGGSTDTTSRMSQWAAELAALQVHAQEAANILGGFHDFGLRSELDFWRSKLAAVHRGTAEEWAVRKRIADLQTGLARSAFDAELTGLRAQMAEYRNNTAERLRIATQQQQAIGRAFGVESREYQAAQAQINGIMRQAAEQRRQIREIESRGIADAALQAVADDEASIRQRAAMGLLSAEQQIAALADLENRRYEIQAEALNRKLVLLDLDPDRNPVALAQTHAELQALERRHAAKVVEIRNDMQRTTGRFALQFWGDVQSGMESLISGIMKGTIKMRDVWSTVLRGMGDILINVASKMSATWLTNFLQQKLQGITTALSQIQAHAAVAGAAAVASTAAIPIVGPAMAPAAGALAYGNALSYASGLAIARQGYDVPAGINPLAQLHAEEMVLPKELANVVRRMAGEGDSGGGVSLTMPVQVSSMDAKAVEQFFDENADRIMARMARAARNKGLRFG